MRLFGAIVLLIFDHLSGISTGLHIERVDWRGQNMGAMCAAGYQWACQGS